MEYPSSVVSGYAKINEYLVSSEKLNGLTGEKSGMSQQKLQSSWRINCSTAKWFFKVLLLL